MKTGHVVRMVHGVRYAHKSHQAATIQDTAVRPSASPAFPQLPSDYDGPLLVVAQDALLGPGARLAANAQLMMQNVVDQQVPIVYLPQTGKHDVDMCSLPHPDAVGQGAAQDYLRALKERLPQAQIFSLLSNQGPTVQGATVPGVTSYLRNNDPTQRSMPAKYDGVLADEFYDVFCQRLASDLENARLSSKALGGDPVLRGTLPTTPMYANAPAVHAATLGDRLKKMSSQVGWAAQSLHMSLAGAIQARHDNRQEARTLAFRPNPELVSAAPTRIAQGIRGLMSLHMAADRRSELVYHMLTSHGSDIGHIDSILSCVERRKVEKALRGEQLAAFLNIERSQAARPGDWDGFEHYMDGMTGAPLRAGNRLKLLVNGDEAFTDKLGSMQKARHFTAMSTFVLGADQFGRHFVHNLEQSLQRGVHVPLLKDPTGSEFTYDRYRTDPRLLANLHNYPHFTYLETPKSPFTDHINHRKLLSMDQDGNIERQVGYIGGMNVDNHYRVNWHDVHCRVEGPAVEDINHLLIQQMGLYDKSGSVAKRYAYLQQPQQAIDGGSNVRIVGHVGQSDHNLKLAYLRAIRTSEKTIDIANPYLSDPDIMNALIERAEHGVKVRLFVPHHNDQVYMQWSARTWYHDLLKSGNIQIFEYNGHDMAHEKVAVFDGRVTTIGSCNLDTRSLQDNEEANLWTNDPRFAEEVTRRVFDADVSKSIPITSYHADLQQDLENKASSLLKGEL